MTELIRERIERLQKRARHLQKRIDSSPMKDLSYDRAEQAALLWAIRHLTTCQGVTDGERDDIGNRRDLGDDSTAGV